MMMEPEPKKQRVAKPQPVVWVGPKDGGWIPIKDPDPGAPKPPPPVDDAHMRPDSTVFVAIASFRDDLCPTTLENLFQQAEHPNRVHVAIVQQNHPDDVDCLREYCRRAAAAAEATAEAGQGLRGGGRGRGSKKAHRAGACPFFNQISIKRLNYLDAKGPTWARAQDADMLPAKGMDFCLRTDSHMAFLPRWDTLQLQQWGLAQNEYAVLSTYPADAAILGRNVNGLWEVPHLCSIQWEGGHVRNMQAKAARNLERPKLTTLWAAGLSFAKCHAERTVPYDPHTPYIFWGEEFSRTARFFTNGYDIYTPHRTIIAHDYKHTQGNRSHFKWNGRGGPRQDEAFMAARRQSNRRIWTLLGMPGGDPSPEAHGALKPYGLGTRRSLDQLMDFTGINLRNRTIRGSRCGNIDWVPWDWEGVAEQNGGQGRERWRRRGNLGAGRNGLLGFAGSVGETAMEQARGMAVLPYELTKGFIDDAHLLMASLSILGFLILVVAGVFRFPTGTGAGAAVGLRARSRDGRRKAV